MYHVCWWHDITRSSTAMALILMYNPWLQTWGRFNSSVAYWRHRYWSTLLHSGNYLSQWFIVSWTLRNNLQWNFNHNTKLFTEASAFKMEAILSQPQWLVTSLTFGDVIFIVHWFVALISQVRLNWKLLSCWTDYEFIVWPCVVPSLKLPFSQWVNFKSVTPQPCGV